MFVRMTLLAALQVLACAGALAGDLSPDLRALIEGFQAHRRVAIGYLRTQNGDLGAVEIERLRERLSADRRKLSPATAADAALASTLARTEAIVADSMKAADGGEFERSRQLLEEAAKPLDSWRKDNGIRLFSDCIAEVTAAYERLDRHRLDRPDLADRSAAEQVTRASEGTVAALDACEREASAEMRREPVFRRLFDGMRDSLRQMPDAVRTRDNALLHRLLIEQRSFERLLSFRFG
jgi:hypothetical protein